ncbi:MAG: hypothetical protein A3G83_12380 [Betaproteobacteria bacterium RIFCSPLOWO2_12_FULL_68_20]|nr:MAG: hypothetical protein A3G83_12380 [Betaproteobacteria bacterium RIFCSPLOWO2_12_FULL_68_20]
MKLVISFGLIENCCQLMIELGVFVIVRIFPFGLMVPPPATKVPPVGFANAPNVANREATSTAARPA